MGWGALVETGRRWKWERSYLGDAETMAEWSRERELQGVCDLMAAGMVIFESLRMSTEKCGEPGYTPSLF